VTRSEPGPAEDARAAVGPAGAVQGGITEEAAEAADDRQLTKMIARYDRADGLCIDLCSATWNPTAAGRAAVPGPDRAGRDSQRRHRLQ
jgi:hypothetical protein